mmetsp:Transcript_60242/g.113676  ORF Transcript_60242/g.113676 Transcript_60242/m.113676 type:complete len:201 (-) Transcript_60242:38-640(-)
MCPSVDEEGIAGSCQSCATLASLSTAGLPHHEAIAVHRGGHWSAVGRLSLGARRRQAQISRGSGEMAERRCRWTCLDPGVENLRSRRHHQGTFAGGCTTQKSAATKRQGYRRHARFSPSSRRCGAQGSCGSIARFYGPATHRRCSGHGCVNLLLQRAGMARVLDAARMLVCSQLQRALCGASRPGAARRRQRGVPRGRWR